MIRGSLNPCELFHLFSDGKGHALDVSQGTEYNISIRHIGGAHGVSHTGPAHTLADDGVRAAAVHTAESRAHLLGQRGQRADGAREARARGVRHVLRERRGQAKKDLFHRHINISY